MIASAPIAGLFDLDGVIVDTAKYHFFAWREIAGELGFSFSENNNERLKGVSRARSLDILLGIGGVAFNDAEKRIIAEKKNNRYLHYIMQMSPDDLLPGAKEFVTASRKAGVRTAIVSASKNASTIIRLLQIGQLFDAVVDGAMVVKSKPDPEGYLLGAKMLNVSPQNSIVFEDAEAGIKAAHAAGMYAVGIGNPQQLKNADICIPGFMEISIETVIAKLNNRVQKEAVG